MKMNLIQQRITKKKLLLVMIGSVLLCAGCSEKAAKTHYVFTTIERGDIENTVTSSGTIEAVGTVDVLSQMTGTVEKIYADYNDVVTKGERLIDLNTEILEIQEKEAEASVLEAQATYDHTLLEYNNNAGLHAKNMLSDFDLDTSKMELHIAKAQLMSAEAQLKQINIELEQYALILSPISGIVLERDVEVGDTVVSGTSATTLFSLAKDLSQMEIHVDVDELDISEITKGQEVRFTVDAYAGNTFSGSVRQIRLVPTTEDNVVTYTVIVDADNQENKLLPGMTATVDFLVEQKANVLLVPNAALRFEPVEEKKEQKASDTASKKGLFSSAMPGGGMGGPPGRGPGGGSGGAPPGKTGNKERSAAATPIAAPTENSAEMKNLWYENEKGVPESIPVMTGVTDGIHTEILGPDDLEGRQIIEKIKVE
jgi:HlyD family secretion protein